MNWSTFWSQFRAAVDSNKDLTDEAYLRDAIQDPSVMFCGAEREGLYDEVVELLCRRYDKKRLIHSNYCKALTELPSVKSTRTDLHQFVDTVRHALAGLRHTEQYDLPAFLTSMLVPCLSKALQVEWEVHTKESRSVPPVEEFLEFVMFRADILSAQPPTTKGPEVHPKATDPNTEHPPRRHRAVVHSSSSSLQSSDGRSIRYHFQVCSLCAKAHEHSKISFYYGGLTGVSSFYQEGSGVVDPTHGEWGTRSHSGSGELAHHLLFSLGSGSAADDTAHTDSTREGSGA